MGFTPPKLRSAWRFFSPTDLLLLAGVMIVILALVAPVRSNHRGPARITAARSQISRFTTALDSFKIEVGDYPPTIEGLPSLVTKPTYAENWHGPYIEEIHFDPWHRPYLYRCPGDKNPESFDLISLGPDGVIGTEDDISN